MPGDTITGISLGYGTRTVLNDNTDTFFASGKKLIQFIDQYCQSIKEYVLQVQKSLHKMFVSIYLSTVSSSMPGGPDKQPTSRSSRQYSPPSNLPTTYHRQWQWMRKRRIKRNKARFISTGPIHQVLSGTRNGRLSICHSQKQAKPGSAPSARHWIIVCQKKRPKKSRFVKSCPELPARAQNTRLPTQSVIFLQFPENVAVV